MKGEIVLNVFKCEIFSLSSSEGTCFKRSPIALAQVKVGNTTQNLLNTIRQIICSLYRANKITKKVNNIMN